MCMVTLTLAALLREHRTCSAACMHTIITQVRCYKMHGRQNYKIYIIIYMT